MKKVDLSTLQLGPDSLRIFIEKPIGWEYLVFAKVLQERVQLYESKRLDVELGISFGPVIKLTDRTSAANWGFSKVTQISQTVKHLTLALNSGFEKAVGKLGEPGDIGRIIHLASRISDGYSQVLDWTLEFHRLEVEPDLEMLMDLASNFSTNILTEIETFSSELYCRVEDVIANRSSGNVVTLTLTLTVPDTKDFLHEIERINSTNQR